MTDTQTGRDKTAEGDLKPGIDDFEYPTRWRDWLYFPGADRWSLTWGIVIGGLFVLPFIPIRGVTFTHNEYIAGPLGIPTFTWCLWAIGLLSVLALVGMYFHALHSGRLDDEPVPIER